MARRYKEARLLNHLKVAEAIEKLEISQPTLSAWEGERKSPSIDALEKMADLYGVTTDYLLGRTDSAAADPNQPVPPQNLLVMNGKPVWSAAYGWMLVHASERYLLCSDGSSIPFSDVGNVFTTVPVFTDAAVPNGHPISKSDLLHYDEVWIEPISPDEQLRNELRGWYRRHTCWYENECGNRFLINTYGVKWLAFDSMLET